jgi:ABC-2 type transport system ATP-binding protein
MDRPGRHRQGEGDARPAAKLAFHPLGLDQLLDDGRPPLHGPAAAGYSNRTWGRRQQERAVQLSEAREEHPMDHAIETHELTRAFGDKKAVDELSLRVAGGRFFGFLGPNGAGKTTTIKMLTGLLKTTSGRASVLGFDVARQAVEVKRRIGVVPEELALFDRLTGAEYLIFVGRMYGLDKATATTRAQELLELMDLRDAKKLIVDYSHGMKKKIAISAALIHEPQLLFLDEPFEGIDPVASRLIKDILSSLVAKGVTVFLTSHILEIVEKLCDEIAIIHEGKLLAQGSCDELQADVVGSEGRTVSLEELFLSLVGTDGEQKKGLSWLE